MITIICQKKIVLGEIITSENVFNSLSFEKGWVRFIKQLKLLPIILN